MATRRAFLLAAAGCTLVASPFAAHPQAKKAPIVICWLAISRPQSDTRRLKVFTEALIALGRNEGVDFVIDAHWANGIPDRLPELATKVAANRPVIIVTNPRPATVAAAQAAPGIPIVQATGGDLVQPKLAASLARPGGMVTGLTNLGWEVSEKQTELLAAVMPELQRVGHLVDGTMTARSRNEVRERAQRVATQYKVQAVFAEASGPEQLESAFAQFRKSGAQAIAVPPGNWITGEPELIVSLALSHRLPVIAGAHSFAEVGALISYGADVAYNYRRAAWYVDQILKGRKPGEIPIEQPTKFILVVNLKTAKALGITIPSWIMLQADRVIG